MLSFKALDPAQSRHIAAIEDSHGETVELIFFTEQARGTSLNNEDFATQLAKYTKEGSSPTDFLMRDEYHLTIVPSNAIKGLQRETVAVFGKSGSGKSWSIKNYLRWYNLLYPRNKILFFSKNSLCNDPSYDEDLVEKITQVNLATMDSAIVPEQHRDSLLVFDDVLDSEITLSPNTIFPEYATASLAARNKMERECEKKARSVMACLNNSVKDALNLGRKYNLSCIAVYHKLRSGVNSTFVVEESSSCWLYPYTASKETIAGFLQQRLSFPKKTAAAIASEKFYSFDFLYVNNAGKLFYFTPNHFKFV